MDILQRTINELEKKIEMLQKDINAIKAKQKNGSKMEYYESESNAPTRLKRSQASIQTKRSRKKSRVVSASPNDKVSFLKSTERHYEDEIKEAEKCLKLADETAKELSKDCKRRCKQFNLEKIMLKHFQNKADHPKSIQNASCKITADELKAKRRKVHAYIQQISHSMETFIRQHYPKVTANDLQNKRTVKNGKVRKAEVCSMGELIENLVHKWRVDPDDPYIEVDASIWPPHLETLLRSHIAETHPTNPNHVKLADTEVT